MYVLASDLEKVVSCSLGVRIYARNAELHHLPIILITESSIPAPAAAVAAPIWKLCLAKFSSGKPRACIAFHILDVKVDLVKGVPFLKLKNGPAAAPCTVM